MDNVSNVRLAHTGRKTWSQCALLAPEIGLRKGPEVRKRRIARWVSPDIVLINQAPRDGTNFKHVLLARQGRCC